AISCAKSSQPYGTGEASREKGEKAVGRDISAVYQTMPDAFEDISNVRYKKLFWKAYRAGETDVAQLILAQFGNKLAGVPIEPFDGGAAHYLAKKSGRFPVSVSKPKMVVQE